ncbi:MAG: response regulator transcription factor [Jatrophihabitantaceae bacterium]
MAQVLLVEDDAAIRTALTRALGEHGHVVVAVGSGMPALSSAVELKPDVMLLDLGLPDIDGSDILSMLRAVSEIPVIVATARDDESEMVRLLNLGADDYIIKPFTAAQVNARIRAVLRRTGRVEEDPVITVGGLRIDTRSYEVSLDGRPIELARKEYELLLVLARRAGEVVSKRELLAEVWQLAWGGSDRTVDVHLSWLRRKLGESAAQPRYLHSLRGVGIRLVPAEPRGTCVTAGGKPRMPADHLTRVTADPVTEVGAG